MITSTIHPYTVSSSTAALLSKHQRKVFSAAVNNIRARCDNPNYARFDHYGGRGIAYDPALVTVEGLFHELGPRPSPDYSIDRIDNNQGYFRGNLRWATRREQALNRRDNHDEITWKGVTQPLTTWAKQVGISAYTLRNRIFIAGWGLDRAMTQRVGNHGPKGPTGPHKNPRKCKPRVKS